MIMRAKEECVDEGGRVKEVDRVKSGERNLNFYTGMNVRSR
jgi:hypothetical protein